MLQLVHSGNVPINYLFGSGREIGMHVSPPASKTAQEVRMHQHRKAEGHEWYAKEDK